MQLFRTRFLRKQKADASLNNVEQNDVGATSGTSRSINAKCKSTVASREPVLGFELKPM